MRYLFSITWLHTYEDTTVTVVAESARDALEAWATKYDCEHRRISAIMRGPVINVVAD